MRRKAVAAAILLACVLGHPMTAQAQTDPTTPTDMRTEDDKGEWGWIGLFGLLGLLGLRRRTDGEMTVRRTSTT